MLVQGTLDMLILKTLALESMHGWGIAQRIEQISKGDFLVNPGSLFPAFRRLERSALVKSEWRLTENNRRAKYYILTDQGRPPPQKKNWLLTRLWYHTVGGGGGGPVPKETAGSTVGRRTAGVPGSCC